MTAFALLLDILVVLLVVHTAVNVVLLRRPEREGVVSEKVSVLMPMRDEAAHAAAAVTSALAQCGLTDQETIVYDDGSSDDTATMVHAAGGTRVRLLTGTAPPPGWLGKPHACARLAEAATGSVLVFVDADVVLAPDAVASAVTLLRRTGLAFVSPYPRQLTGSLLERLVQPLLQWSWLTFLPLRLAEHGARPSLAAANGQFLVVDTETYRRAGGHGVVRGEVVEDMALARALVRAGGRGTFVDGSSLATCRMYDGGRAVVEGYAKSLWCAFGSQAAALGVAGLILLVGVVPWALLAATPLAWPAAAGGIVGRVIAALRAGNRPVVDALLHPLSALCFAALVAVSLRRRASGTLTWKARPVA